MSGDPKGDGGAAGAANWSEIAQKLLWHGRDWSLARGHLPSYGLDVEAVTADDAEWAARRWKHGEGLSLGDRLCLAHGERLDATIWTTDRTWGTGGRLRQVR